MNDREELFERLGRIEAKVDAVLLVTTDHETRLRGLEKFKWAFPGGGVLAALLGLFSFHH